MQKVIIKLYLKGKRRPEFTLQCEDDSTWEKLFKTIDEARTTVLFGQIMFNKSEFRRAVLIYK